MTPRTILVVDDSELVHKMHGMTLRKYAGCQILHAYNGAEALDVLNLHPEVELVLLDVNMPVIDVRRGLDAGATAYLAKPFKPPELEARLRAGKRITDLQAELVAAREAQRALATRDALTGLWNRGAIFDLYRKEHARARRELRPLSVVMVDLDHFKRVNDTHGHPAGDAVLREAARRLGAGTRTYDAVGRYGGEEFLVLLPGCLREAAVARAEQLRLAVAAEPISAGDEAIAMTASLGVATREADGDIDAEAFLKAADEALYRAKAGGRNQVGWA